MRAALALAGLGALVLFTAGCGSSNDTESATTTDSSTVATTTTSSATTAVPPSSSAPTSESTPADAPAVAVDPATFNTPDYGYVWTSPTKNISCRIAEGEYNSGCMSGDAPVPAGADCVTPSFTIDQLGKGFYLENGTVIPTCFNQGIFGLESAPALEYDQSVSVDGYTCTSRTTGMSCTTTDGHGFELSNEVARSY